jgi:hypothetical protein
MMRTLGIGEGHQEWHRGIKTGAVGLVHLKDGVPAPVS